MKGRKDERRPFESTDPFRGVKDALEQFTIKGGGFRASAELLNVPQVSEKISVGPPSPAEKKKKKVSKAGD